MPLPAPGTFPPGEHGFFAIDPASRDGVGPYAVVEPARLEERLRALAGAHPDLASVVELGRTWQDQPVLALRLTRNPERDEDEPAVLLTGGTHGHELLSVLYALDAAEGLLGDDALRPLLDRLDVWVVPELNPDGVWTTLWSDARGEDRSGRKNGRDLEPPPSARRDGVDLNRNFPYGWGERGSSELPGAWDHRGAAPGSEPETRALMALAERYRFAASISFHTSATAVITPYSVDRRPAEPDVPLAVARALAAASPQPFRVVRRLYPVSGTDQDWLYHSFGTVAFTVEGSHHNPLAPARIEASIDGVRPIWRGLLERVADGPRVSVHVRDPDGQPLAARVTLVGHVGREGEVWTARPGDGRLDLLLADPGPVTIRAGYGDLRPAEATVDLDPGAPVADAELVLPWR